MKIVGRSCDACGARVDRDTQAKGCGACDVVVCLACLRGTDRCPGCQRRFGEVRHAVPVRVRATPKRSWRAEAGLVIAPLFAIVIFIARLEATRDEPAHEVVGGVVGTPPAPPSTADVLFDRAVDARDSALVHPSIGSAPCTEDLSGFTWRADRLRSFRFTPRTESELGWVLGTQLGFLNATLTTSSPDVQSPFTGRVDGDSSFENTASLPHRLVLILDAWDDPRDGARGRARGRVVLWSRARSAPVCAASVDVEGPDEPIPAAADPLAFARAELVVHALRDGLPRLSALTP